MKKSIRRKIEQAFREYKTKRSCAIDHVCDWAWDNTAVRYDLIRVQGNGGIPGEERLIEKIEENYRDYAWCRVVEKTLEHYQFDMPRRQLIVFRYFDKFSETKTIYKISISRATYFRWKDEILKVAFLWAREFKLFGELKVAKS